jgi:repressor LexA
VSDITPRQQRIVDFIAETVRERGYPPTVREIGEAVGLTSSSSARSSPTSNAPDS